MKRLIICTILIVGGIEGGKLAFDALQRDMTERMGAIHEPE